MANNSKKYVSLDKLQKFLENLSNKFALITHRHSVNDIDGYTQITVDTALSPTSTNPVQNKVLNEEFDAIGDAMGALEMAFDNHNHNDIYYTKTEIDNLEFITTDDIDAICGTTIQIATASEVTF